MDVKIYTGFSPLKFWWAFILRLSVFIVGIMALSNFNENPPVISVVAAICLLIILRVGDDQVTVYADKVERTRNSLWSLIFKSKITFYIRDIQSASAPIGIASEASVQAFFSIFFLQYGLVKTIPFYIDFRNGKAVKLYSQLEVGKIQKVVTAINAAVSDYKEDRLLQDEEMFLNR